MFWSHREAGATGTRITEGKDLQNREFSFENKRTDKGSMSVKLEWLEEIQKAATRSGKDPGVILTFERPRKDPEDWVAIPISVFERLCKDSK